MTREAEASDRELDTVGQKRPPLGAGLNGSPESLVPYSLGGYLLCTPWGDPGGPHRDVTKLALMGGDTYGRLRLYPPLPTPSEVGTPSSTARVPHTSAVVFRLLATCLRGRTATFLLFGDGPKLTLKPSAKRALGPRYIAMGVRRDKRENRTGSRHLWRVPPRVFRAPPALFA